MSTATFDELQSLPTTAAAETTRCECCGSDAHAPVARKRGFNLHRCNGCGVVFVHPQPTAEQLAELYHKSAGYFATAQTDLSNVKGSSAHWLENALLAGGVASGRFLDVGCANGALMAAMRKNGWTVSGVDVNSDAVAVATANGLDARIGTLESANFADDSFDVAYLGDVIEHVPSPRAACREIWRILRPGGVVAMRTPDAQSGFARITMAMSRLLGVSWAHSEAPYHIHEFTRPGLAALLESSGFEVCFNRSEGSSRFLYKLGATGMFDDLKRRMKRAGGYRVTPAVLPQLPLVAAVGALLAPVYAAGKVFDKFVGGGAAIFIGARKKVGTGS